MEHEGDSNVDGVFWTILKGLVKGVYDLEIRGQVKTIQNKALYKIGNNTEKGPGH